jgi:hypothetical protein
MRRLPRILGAEALKELARTRRRNADKVDPGIGRTRLGQRIFECVVLIGTRSAQSIMASGFTAAQTGRTHDRTRQCHSYVRKFLPRRRSHMTHGRVTVISHRTIESRTQHDPGAAHFRTTFESPFTRCRSLNPPSSPWTPESSSSASTDATDPASDPGGYSKWLMNGSNNLATNWKFWSSKLWLNEESR